MKTKHVVVTLMLIMTGLLCCACGAQKEGSSDQLEGMRRLEQVTCTAMVRSSFVSFR